MSGYKCICTMTMASEILEQKRLLPCKQLHACWMLFTYIGHNLGDTQACLLTLAKISETHKPASATEDILFLFPSVNFRVIATLRQFTLMSTGTTDNHISHERDIP